MKKLRFSAILTVLLFAFSPLTSQIEAEDFYVWVNLAVEFEARGYGEIHEIHVTLEKEERGIPFLATQVNYLVASGFDFQRAKKAVLMKCDYYQEKSHTSQDKFWSTYYFDMFLRHRAYLIRLNALKVWAFKSKIDLASANNPIDVPMPALPLF